MTKGEAEQKQSDAVESDTDRVAHAPQKQQQKNNNPKWLSE